MPRIPISVPLGGLSETFAFDEQPPRTSRDAKNVRGRDPRTGRYRGASRAGLTKFTTAPIAQAPVRRIEQVTYNVPSHQFTSAGANSTIAWSDANPTKTDTKGTDVDDQSNLYTLDGASGLAKFNSSGVQLWKTSIPTKDKAHQCIALRVHKSTGFVYVGVGAGGDSTKGQLFCYRQLENNETELVWTVDIGGYVAQLRIHNTQLYALVNFPDQNSCFVIVYDGITSGAPTEAKRWPVQSQGNDFDVSAVDGSIFEASGADANRGNDPRSPGSTQKSSDWTWEKLDHFKDRVWSWFDASDRDSLSLSPASPDAGDDGAEVVVWFDKSGKSRNWYANRGISAYPVVPSTEAGPLYKPVGLGGLPSISFSGETYTASTPGRSMVGQPASSTDRAYRNEQLSPVPTYKGAQFVLFLVVKAGIDETMRGLLSLPSPGSNTASKLLTINRRDDNDVPGTVPMPGSVSWRDPNGRASDAGTSTPPAGGPSGSPSCAPGMLPASGVAVITIICDGGVHDGNSQNGLTGQSSRSIIRINGHPIDRWQSESFNTSAAITLGLAYLGSSGHSRFAGLVCEMRVLSDWYDQNGVQQRLVTAPAYPDALWQPNGDTEVERIEGELAHKWGFAHELETGQVGWANMTQPANNETVTVGATTYRFVNALSQANDILIGSSVFVTASRFFEAIGRIGNPGVDYDQRTEKNSALTAMAATQIGSSNTCRIPIRSISPYATQVTLASSSGGAITWDAPGTRLVVNGAGTSLGWYPHPFTLKKTTNSRGGPPGEAANTQGQISPPYLLQSPYPSLSKWSANTGKPVWVATSGYNVIASPANGNTSVTTSGSGLGGVGLAVRIGSKGQVFSVGNQQATVSGREAILADAIDIRKFGDTGATFTISGTGDPWADQVLAVGVPWDSTIIRCDIDKFDNFYVPIFSSSASLLNASLLGYRSASDAAGGGVLFINYAGLPLHQDCYSVSIDPNIPEFPAADLIQHAEFIYLGSVKDPADTANLSIFKVRMLSSVLLPGEGRVRKIIAIAGGIVARIDSGVPVSIGGGIDANASYVDTAPLFGKVFITDGSNLYVYDPKDDTLKAFQPTSSGQFLPRCKILAAWNGRLVGAESADNGNNWFMSKQGDPFNCDLLPFTTPTEQQAVLGADSRLGVNPDKITALFTLKDDLLIIGCDGSIHRLTGDPMAGGTFHPISTQIGIAPGRTITQDPYGTTYFLSPEGGIYRLLGDAVTVQPLSLDKIPERIQAIDLTTYRVELAWSHREDGLRVMVVPIGSGGTHVESFFWERKTDSWHVDDYGNDTTTNMQPTCVFAANGDAPDDRVLLFGCEDGIVRQVDLSATDDDGFPIDSSMLMGPFVPDNEGNEFLFTDFEIVLDKRQRGARWSVHATDLTQDPGDDIGNGVLQPGRNKILIRARGAAVWLRLSSAALDGAWAVESIACRAEPMGITRALA